MDDTIQNQRHCTGRLRFHWQGITFHSHPIGWHCVHTTACIQTRLSASAADAPAAINSIHQQKPVKVVGANRFDQRIGIEQTNTLAGLDVQYPKTLPRRPHPIPRDHVCATADHSYLWPRRCRAWRVHEPGRQKATIQRAAESTKLALG